MKGFDPLMGRSCGLQAACLICWCHSCLHAATIKITHAHRYGKPHRPLSPNRRLWHWWEPPRASSDISGNSCSCITCLPEVTYNLFLPLPDVHKHGLVCSISEPHQYEIWKYYQRTSKCACSESHRARVMVMHLLIYAHKEVHRNREA